MMNIRTSVTVSHGRHARVMHQTYQRAESHSNGHQLIVGTGANVFDHCGERDITRLKYLNHKLREVDSPDNRISGVSHRNFLWDQRVSK